MRSPLVQSLAATLLLAAAVSAAPSDLPAAGEVLEGDTQSTMLDLSGESDADLRAALAAYDPQSESFPWTLTKSGSDWGGTEVYELKFPTAQPSKYEVNNTVWCRYYPAQGLAPGDKAPLAFVLHHLAGDFDAESILADFLARAGIHAVEVEFPYYGPRKPKGGGPRGLIDGNLDGAVDGFHQGIADIRQIGRHG